MNILMLTNTFTPHVGGVARSVESFTSAYRRRGHRVVVVAPTFEGAQEEPDVVRIPAIQNFNGSDFSLPVPMPGLLTTMLAEAPPDVVHSHHPFLLGDTALRVGAAYSVPVVFTHHTLYDQYTHYLASDSPTLQRIAIDIATGYCNLCHGIVAPSESVATMLSQHGVEVPIEIIPTGVEAERFGKGDGADFRRKLEIPKRAIVVGHLGRLAPEKNLAFLAEAVARFVRGRDRAYFLVVGSGPMEGEITSIFEQHDLSDRLRLAGQRCGDELTDAYHAMDVFAFASQTETQGMVVTEAMAAGLPVVAVDAPGVRDVVEDGRNGRLLAAEDADEFAAALAELVEAPAKRRRQLAASIRTTVEHFSLEQCAARALAFYERLQAVVPHVKPTEDSAWAAALRWIEEELKIIAHHAKAVGGALVATTSPDEDA